MILEDIAPPPHEHLGPLQCPCHQVPTRSSPSAVWAVHTGVQLETSVLGLRCQCWLFTLVLGSKNRCWVILHTHFGNPSHVCSGCQQWDSPVILVLCFPCFNVLCMPTEGQGSRWGGLPTFTGVVLVSLLVDLAFEVVFAVFDIHLHSCSCLLAINRQVVGTHSIG